MILTTAAPVQQPGREDLLAADWHPNGDRPEEQPDAGDETAEEALAAALGRLEEALAEAAE